MTWNFQQIPAIVNSQWSIDLATEQQAAAPADNRAEVEAVAHWIFGTDFPDLSDLITGRKLAQNLTLGSVTGGSGYTYANVVITGGGGTGMKATAVVSGGAVTRVYITDYGQDYYYEPIFTIVGDGTGAAVNSVTLAGIPTLTANSMQPAGIPSSGLRTSIKDTLVETLWVVAQYDPTATASGNGDFFGNFPNNPDTGGFLFWFQNTSEGAPGFRSNPRLTNGGSNYSPNLVPTNPGINSGDWFFAALRSSTVTENVFIGKGGALTESAPAAGTYPKSPIIPDTRVISLGGTNANHNIQVPFAEFGIFDYALSDTEIAALFARATARMAARGVTLV